MKKLILFAAVIMIVGCTHGQTLQKGNFIGFHVYTINLDPNVTLNQFLDVWKNKVIPEYEKNFQCKGYLVKGIRGECPNCFAGMWVWKSEADRDKFFNKEDELNDLGQAALDKMKPALDELAKLGATTTKYTDWVIQ